MLIFVILSCVNVFVHCESCASYTHTRAHTHTRTHTVARAYNFYVYPTQTIWNVRPRLGAIGWRCIFIIILNHYCSIPTVKHVYNDNHMHMPYTDAQAIQSRDACASHTATGITAISKTYSVWFAPRYSIYSERLYADSSGVSILFGRLSIYAVRILCV